MIREWRKQTNLSSEGTLLKLIIAGEGGVGKTTFVRRFVEGVYHDSILTVGTAFAAKRITVDDGNGQQCPVKLQLWDFAGEKRFRSMLPKFCVGARGAILSFDLSRFSTFLKLSEWLTMIRSNTEGVPIVLVGMKADLLRAVDQKEAIDFTQSQGLKAYFESSAKTGFQVIEVFQFIAKAMLDYTRNRRAENG